VDLALAVQVVETLEQLAQDDRDVALVEAARLHLRMHARNIRQWQEPGEKVPNEFGCSRG